MLRKGKDAAILTFGTTIPMALEAAEQLAARGIDVEVVNARFIKPLDGDMLRDIVRRNMPMLTIEETVLQGGFGSAVLEFMSDERLHATIDRIGIPDQFIEHGDVPELLAEINVTTEEAVKRIELLVNNTEKVGQ